MAPINPIATCSNNMSPYDKTINENIIDFQHGDTHRRSTVVIFNTVSRMELNGGSNQLGNQQDGIRFINKQR